MFLPVILIAATFFISASLGSEESCYLTEEQEDECASVCYPIVKPLLRYFEKCQGWEAQISQSQKDFSNLEKRHWEVQRNNDKLIAQIDKKNTEIELLKNQINDQKKTSELEILINQLREEIERIRRIEKSGEVPQANQNKTHTEERTKENKNSNNETDKVEVKTGEVSANQQDNSRNQTKSETQTKALPDSCSQNQKEEWVVQEIQIPGSDPLKVACLSHSKVGSGWMLVYGINDNTTMLNRTYEEYATGFGDRTDYRNNFFIGLENLHLLTNKEPYEMYLIDHYYKCDNFVIGNRTEGYLVKHVGECSGISFMSLHQGTTFSTFDRDEDGHPDRNLAKEFGYGWWFNYK
nr:fibroleukin-like [Drosophila bipectinata]